MSEERPGLLDRAVETIAAGMDALGLNGTRFRWRWYRRRRDVGETVLRAEIEVRGATGRHKMCPSCRALVPRGDWTCPECGAGLAAVRAPGLGRLVEKLIPGATAATGLIALINGALFLLLWLAPYVPPGVEPREGFGLMRFDPYSLVRYGMGSTVLTFGAGELWRVVTPIFLHGGLIHFLMNTWVLIQLGPLAEEEYGTERFGFIYLASGIVGSFASQFLRHANTVGASGAICGLLALMLVHGWRRGGAYGHALRTVMLQNTGMMVVMSLLPGVDLLNHLGGFLTGFVLGWIVPYGPFRGRAAAILWDVLMLAAVATALWSFWRMAIDGPASLGLLLR